MKSNDLRDIFDSCEIEAFGSNPISRFIAHVSAPFSGGEDKLARLRLLRSAATLRHHLNELNDYSLSKDPLAIHNCLYKARDIFYVFENDIIIPIISAISKRDAEEKVVSEFLSDEIVENIDEPKDNIIKENVSYIDLKTKLSSVKKELDFIKSKFPAETFKHLSKRYHEISRQISYAMGLLDYDIEGALDEYRSIVKEFSNFSQEADLISDSFVKDASAISRVIDRGMLKWFTSSKNQERSIRLVIDEIIGDIISLNNSFMDSLEDGSTRLYNLGSYVIGISELLSGLFEKIIKISEITNSDIRMNKYFYKSRGDSFPYEMIPNTDINSLKQMVKTLNGVRGAIKDA